MLTRRAIILVVILVAGSWALAAGAFVYYRSGAVQSLRDTAKPHDSSTEIIEVQPGTLRLPSPVTVGAMSVEEAIYLRRSRREYLDKPLDGLHLSQLLWAAQGITEPRWGLRAAPSAGGTYPLEIYAVVGENCVIGLKAGIYRYSPKDHTITLLRGGDHRAELSVAALSQPWVANAPINIIVSAAYERTTRVYGSRGERYVHLEAGHVAQNVYLIATAMGLGNVVLGAFDDQHVQRLLNLPNDETPLYIIPVGYPSG